MDEVTVEGKSRPLPVFTFADELALLGMAAALIALWFIPWKDVATLVILATSLRIGYTIISTMHKDRLKKTPPSPLTKLEEQERINRSDLRSLFEHALRNNKHRVVIVSGKSGVGKSIAACSTLESIAMGKGYKINKINSDFIIVKEYDHTNFVEAIRKGIGNDRNITDLSKVVKNKKIFILDQFESVFQPPLDTRKIEDLREFFKQIKKVKKGLVKVFLIIREEWFANLFVFRDCIDWEQEIIPVYGIPESDKDIMHDLLGKLSNHIETCENEDLELDPGVVLKELATPDNKVLTLDKNRKPEYQQTLRPVEILTGLKMLSLLYPDKARGITKQEYEKLGGIRGLIREYLRFYIEQDEDRRSAARILFSLSVVPQERGRLDIKKIMFLTQLGKTEVNRIVEKMVCQGLLKKSVDGYDWSHDYLAELCHEISGSFIRPEERDNISFFWYRLRRGQAHLDDKTMEQKEKKHIREVYGYFILSMSIATLLICGVFSPMIRANPWPEPFYSLPSPEGFERIDIPLLFVAISLFAWAYYIFRLHNKLLIELGEQSWVGLFLTWTLPLVSFLCIVGTVLNPPHWLTFTGIGGFWVGIKFIQLSHLKPDLWFLRAGRETVFNSLVVGFLGYFFYARIFGTDSILRDATWTEVGMLSLFIWGIMMWFATFVSFKNHASREVIPMLRMFYRRIQLS